MIRVLRELRADAASPALLSSLSVGLTSGLGLLVAQIAYATFIFSGDLAHKSSQGVGLILFGNFAACLVFALFGGFRGVIAGLSPALVIGMASIASGMDTAEDALFVSVSLALMITAVVVGLGCLMVGRSGLANLMRFIPFPVSAGFVAGIGAAVALAALSLMGSGSILDIASWGRWMPGVAYGLLLFLAMKRWHNALILPLSVMCLVAAYHIGLGALGISGAEAREAGLLLVSTAEGNLWPSFGLSDLARVDWAALAKQGPNMFALLLVAFVCVVMNIAGLEVATNDELDWNREFKASGYASMIAGAGGGIVATIIVPASLRSALFGASTRLTGVVAALVIAAAIFLGDDLLDAVPTALVGGILIFAGLGMLDEGLVRNLKRLPVAEIGIILLILVVIVAFGLVEGVAVGIFVTLVFLVVRLSRVDVIESECSLRERRSNRIRPVPEQAMLMQLGHLVRAYELKGYIFFGSVSLLSESLRKALSRAPRPLCLALDFSAVSGFDYSSVHVLARLLQSASAAGVCVQLSALPAHLQQAFELHLSPDDYSQIGFRHDADLALERCEDRIIAEWKAARGEESAARASLFAQSWPELDQYLARQSEFEALVETLAEVADIREHEAGESLVQTQAPDAVQLILSGRASAYDEADARVRQFGAGDAVSPMASEGAPFRSVTTDTPCKTMRIAKATLEQMEANRPELALRLYAYLLGM